ncbi:MAG: hypothetical protein IPM35_15530 [Myxococcales bacterium]|nr:hypothetical protein [Myxococcales bacterium]
MDADAKVPSCVIPPQVPAEYLRPNRTIGECPKLGPACASSPFGGAPLLTASEIDPEARFMALSRELVVAERPTTAGATESLVVRVPADSLTPFLVLSFVEPLPPGMLVRAIDGHALLSCDATDCRIDRIDATKSIVEPTFAHPPAQTQPAGVVDWEEAELICVYGNGVQCFDGKGWLELVPAGSGPRFNAAAATSTSLWAAGDAGRAVIATTECWTELESGTKHSLRSLSADRGRELWAVAAGDAGVLSYLGLDQTITCSLGDSATWVLRDWGQNWGYGVADSYDHQWVFQSGGSVIQGRPSIGGDWCTTQLGETVIDATWFNCGIAQNQRVITSHALIGESFCAID